MRRFFRIPLDRLHRPRSIRGRITLTAMVGLALALIPAAAASSYGVRQAVRGHHLDEAAAAARHVTLEIHQRRYAGLIPALGEVHLIQIVGAAGRPLAASKPLAGEPPISRIRPEQGDSRVNGAGCRPTPQGPRDCLIIVGFRAAGTVYGEVMVYAAVPQPGILTTHWLELGLALLTAALIAGGGWIIWQVIGWTLRPVRLIADDLSAITASRLNRRIRVPHTHDEIAELARAVNATLHRLDGAVERQRRFVADASHELRTPVTGLRTKIELGLADPDGTDLTGTLTAALRDVERLQHVVADLLQLARLDAGRPPPAERFDLAALAAAEADRRSGRLPVELDLEWGAVVACSRVEIARVLANLLANADRHADAHVLLRVHADRERGTAVAEVHDDGPGVPPADRERIFERFTRLDTARSRDAGGSGLGLAIAREGATAHGGTLEVATSTRLGGAAFTLRLPLARLYCRARLWPRLRHGGHGEPIAAPSARRSWRLGRLVFPRREEDRSFLAIFLAPQSRQGGAMTAHAVPWYGCGALSGFGVFL